MDPNVIAAGQRFTDYFLGKEYMKKQIAELRGAGHTNAADALDDTYTRRYVIPETYLEKMSKGTPAGELEELSKGFDGVTTATIAAQTPQSLDPVVQTLMWTTLGADVCTTLKIVARVPAGQLIWNYATETATGMGGSGGASSETGIGNQFIPSFERLSIYLKNTKVHATASRQSMDVNQLPAFPGDGEPLPLYRARENHFRMRNQALLWANTSGQRGGRATGLVADGLIPIIQKTTAGLTAADSGNFLPTSSFNYLSRLGHTVDLLGQELTGETEIRQASDIISSEWFNQANVGLMPRKLISNLEKNLATGRRFLDVWQPRTLGQVVTGVTVAGQHMQFIPEADLDPRAKDNWYGLYTTNRPPGYPTSTLTLTVTAEAEGTGGEPTDGLWDANYGGADTVYYLPTFCDSFDRESYGTISSGVAIVAGQQMKIIISGAPPDATRIRLYRAQSGSGYGVTAASACWIADIAPSTDGSPVTYYDHNVKRPYCVSALFMYLQSPALDGSAFMAGEKTWDASVAANGFANNPLFMGYNEAMRKPGTIGIAYLGADMATLNIPVALDVTISRMTSSTWAPFVRNPYACWVMTNIRVPQS